MAYEYGNQQPNYLSEPIPGVSQDNPEAQVFLPANGISPQQVNIQPQSDDNEYGYEKKEKGFQPQSNANGYGYEKKEKGFKPKLAVNDFCYREGTKEPNQVESYCDTVDCTVYSVYTVEHVIYLHPTVTVTFTLSTLCNIDLWT